MRDDDEEDATPQVGRKSIRAINKILAQEDLVNNAPAIKLILEDLEEKTTELDRLRRRQQRTDERDRRAGAVMSTFQALGGVLAGIAGGPVINEGKAAGAWLFVAGVALAMLLIPLHFARRRADEA